LLLAARGLWRSETALGSFLRRLKARLGAPQATTATAHKLARLLYQTLKTGQLPAQESAAAYAEQQRQQAVAALLTELDGIAEVTCGRRRCVWGCRW
jgi:hypothetical protein